MTLQKYTLLLCVMFGFISYAQSPKSKKMQEPPSDNLWHYDIECVGIGDDGTYMIRVWTYSTTPQIANNQDKKNAVHGIIFRGFEDGEGGATAKEPLAKIKDVEQQYSDFFKDFFSDNGMYINYIAAVATGSTKVIKTGKASYKIGVIISVAKDQLRKDLEKAGVIKSLDSGF